VNPCVCAPPRAPVTVCARPGRHSVARRRKRAVRVARAAAACVASRRPPRGAASGGVCECGAPGRGAAPGAQAQHQEIKSAMAGRWGAGPRPSHGPQADVPADQGRGGGCSACAPKSASVALCRMHRQCDARSEDRRRWRGPGQRARVQRRTRPRSSRAAACALR